MKSVKTIKLRSRIIITTVIVCILALVIQGGVLIYMSTHSFSQKAYEDMEYFLENNHTMLGNKMLYIESLILNLRNDPSMQAFFAGDYDPEKTAEQYAFCVNLTSEQNLVNSYVPFVTQVYAFNQKGDLQREYYNMSSMTSQAIREAEDNARKVCEEYKDVSTTANWYVRDDTIYLIVKLYSSHLEEQGICLVCVDKNAFGMILSEVGKYPEAFWVVLDSKGGPILNHGDELSSESIALLQKEQRYKIHFLELEGISYLVVLHNLSFGLKSVDAVPASQIYDNLLPMLMSTIVVLVLLLPSMFIVAIFSSRTVTKPLKKVANTIEQFGRGELKTQLESFGVQEFDDIGKIFNEMTERINCLITQVYENQLLATQAQLRYLQSQMNPHFLYNVLATIALRSKLDGNEDVYRMVYSLSNLLQGKVFRSGEIKIPLREEMKLVEYYLYLQNVRFPDKLTYQIDCEPSLLDVLVPRMSIEPLLENSVVHGLETKEGEGHIELRVFQEEGYLHIQVNDNGIGFTAESIRSDGHSHMGLKNIEQLLHNLYGDDCSMVVESTPGIGTKVSLILPKKEEKLY